MIHIFLGKQNVYKHNENQQCLGGKGKDRVTLNKNLIYERIRRGTFRRTL